jgi:hypothetical protein
MSVGVAPVACSKMNAVLQFCQNQWLQTPLRCSRCADHLGVFQDQGLALPQWYEYCKYGARSRWLYGTCDGPMRASGGYPMSNRVVELAMLLAFLASLAAVVAFAV